MSCTLQPFRSLVFAVAIIAVLGTACRTTKESSGDDLGASMHELHTQVIEQMRAAGASASQIREVEKQLDKVEREARRMEKQMEKLEKQDQ
jgi:TolA-binding protein